MVRRALLAAAPLCLIPSIASACSCMPVSLAERLDKAAVAYWGRVTSVDDRAAPGEARGSVEVVVEESIKGTPGRSYRLSTLPKDSSCYVAPKIGSRLRVFMTRDEASGLSTQRLSLCSV